MAGSKAKVLIVTENNDVNAYFSHSMVKGNDCL